MGSYHHVSYKRTNIEGRTVPGLDGSPHYLRPMENLLGEIRFPWLMRNTRIPRVELHQRTPCRHTLSIQDRTLDGRNLQEYWLQANAESDSDRIGRAFPRSAGIASERDRLENDLCSASNLLPIAAAILRERYDKITEQDDTITLPKQGVRIADLTTLLVRELPPHLNVHAVSIINYARSGERPAEIVDATGKHSHWYR